MTWIKICGITNVDDALAASEAGANALGFVFCEGSPRFVNLETAAAIAAAVPPAIEKVGVFANSTFDHVVSAVGRVGLTAVQLHGEEDAGFSRELFHRLAPMNGHGRPTIFRSCPARIFDAPAGQCVGWDPVAAGVVEPDEAYEGKRVHKIHVAQNRGLVLHGFRPGVISGVLLDSSSAEERGGTGRPFDWEKVRPWAGIINSISRLIVAGGLQPGNVREAIHLLHPWGVDVSSGVEASPGRKDPKKIRSFIDAVRGMEEAA